MSGEELSFDEYDEIVNTAIKQIYKDNECIALQRIIKRQQKEIEELKNKITDLENQVDIVANMNKGYKLIRLGE